jgi:hypothetical protein
MVCHVKLRHNNIPQIMLLLKNNEITPTQVAEHLNFALPWISINHTESSNIERGRFDNNRNQKVTKQVLFIGEEANEIRASMTFNDTHDYKLNSKEYVENKGSKERKRK